jgi:hypothetical protein
LSPRVPRYPAEKAVDFPEIAPIYVEPKRVPNRTIRAIMTACRPYVSPVSRSSVSPSSS